MITTILLITATLLLQSCNKTTTEPEQEHEVKPSGKIEVVNSSCDELWLNLSVDNIELPVTVNFYFETKPVNVFLLSSTDTTLYIDSLDAGRNYKGKFTFVTGEEEITTEEYLFTTLDTTSQNYSWETFEFGEHNNSVLYDVAIIDENNIWAVGEIYMKDSSGNYDPHAYNAVHWDGTRWELKRIGNQGGWPCRTVFAFSENDVWFEGVIKWDGSKYTVHKNGWPLLPNGDGWQVNKMWGSSSNDLYAVGNGGNIAHWDGSSWKKIESGTTFHFGDVWGVVENQTYSQEIYCAAMSENVINQSVILKIAKGKVTNIDMLGLSASIATIWINDTKKALYAGGDGVFYKKNIHDNKWIKINSQFTNYFTTKIRGCEGNDIWVVGAFGSLAHYNGIDWKNYLYDETPYFYGGYNGLSIKGEKVCAVGIKQTKGIITIGKRVK
jgi:hypothetical protein